MQDVREAVRAEVKSAGEPLDVLASERFIRALYLLVGLAAIVLVFRHLQLSTQGVCCGDFDGYYHIKWSQLLWQRISSGHLTPPAFTWLPLTTLNPKDYVDHHLFFHILQIPFTWFGDLRMGAKVASIFYASLALFSCYWLIVRYRIRYPLCWLIALLACSAPFLYRLNMAKAPPVAIIFMVIGIYLLFEKKYVWLAPLTFLFVWTYSLFVTLLAATLVWTCVVAWSERRFEGRPLLWTWLVGFPLGMIVNPYFPKNIKLLIEHILMKARSGNFTTAVGTEWYPYESWYLLGSCFVAFVAMVVGYVAYNGQDRKRAARPLFFLIFSTLLMLASFRYRRFVEYWPPFAVLFAAFSLQPLFEGIKNAAARLPSSVMDELLPFLDRHEPPLSAQSKERERTRHWNESEVALIGFSLGVILYFIALQFYYDPHFIRRFNALLIEAIAGALIIVVGLSVYLFYRHWAKASAAAAVAVLCAILFFNIHETAKSIAEDRGPDYYEGGMQWIAENVQPGQMIFNTDWDDFPKMFYLDTTHAYASGLDPTYLLDQNAELSKLYVDITLGNEKDPGPLIRDRFGARYVFSDNEQVHDNFYNAAMDSGWFGKVYEDEECTVLRIRDEKGVPAPDEIEEASEDETQPTPPQQGEANTEPLEINEAPPQQ
ncbi:MAG TPA: hypothetical protein VF658_14545 [Pyrinomonadaceae bacterium]|jgi:hypothetical protein